MKIHQNTLGKFKVDKENTEIFQEIIYLHSKWLNNGRSWQLPLPLYVSNSSFPGQKGVRNPRFTSAQTPASPLQLSVCQSLVVSTMFWALRQDYDLTYLFPTDHWVAFKCHFQSLCNSTSGSNQCKIQFLKFKITQKLSKKKGQKTFFEVENFLYFTICYFLAYSMLYAENIKCKNTKLFFNLCYFFPLTF